VAEAVGLHQHLRDLLAAVRARQMRVFIAPHRRWRPGDFADWRYPAPILGARPASQTPISISSFAGTE
jgi:hypothetical protein